MSDKYAGFVALKAAQMAKDFAIHQREGTSGIAIIAPHGGGIEPGTLELADAIAEGDHGYYAFEGKKASGNYEDLHITSTNFDEPIGIRLVQNSQTAVAIHGCAGEDQVVYLGGRNSELQREIHDRLQEAGFEVGKHSNPSLQGLDSGSICNGGRDGSGVQLEIPEGLRSQMFNDLTRNGRSTRTPVFHRFVTAMRLALSKKRV
jgi:phage replication-related protein YjqB (UPF0714/DUF867 family)